jgi:acetylornithine deacetylase
MPTTQDILSHLVGFNTTSHLSNRACIDFIRDYLDEFGIRSHILVTDDGSKACLWATIGEIEGCGLVLSGHTDVVPVDGQNWSSDPFTLTERDDKFYGRGACDMKAFLACVLAAVPEFAAKKLTRPVHLAFTHDEETNMQGARNLTEYLSKEGITPEWVWIGEPTELNLIDQHKGSAYFETKITGVPGHSGKPHLGLNAIELGAHFTNILLRIAEQKKHNPFPQSRFEPPYSTINLGITSGGTAENIIAEHWRLVWQLRSHPGDDLDATLAEIADTADREIAPKFKTFAPRAAMETCTCSRIPALKPVPGNIGETLLKRLTGRTETQAVSFATEAGFYQQLGAPVIVCGPGSIDQAHKADEFVNRQQLDACTDLVRNVVAELL